MPKYIDIDQAKELQIYSAERYEYVIPVVSLVCLPPADVQEVKHAKWVHYGEDVQCSNCGHVSDDICFGGDMDSGYYTVLPHYCSNCGAKMDLEDK